MACTGFNLAVKLSTSFEVLEAIEDSIKARTASNSLSNFIRPSGVYKIATSNLTSEIEDIKAISYPSGENTTSYLVTAIKGASLVGDHDIYFTPFDEHNSGTNSNGGIIDDGDIIISGGGGTIGGLLGGGDGDDENGSSSSSGGSSSTSSSSGTPCIACIGICAADPISCATCITTQCTSSSSSSSSGGSSSSSSSSSGCNYPKVCKTDTECNCGNPFSRFHCIPQKINVQEPSFCVDIEKHFNATATVGKEVCKADESSYPIAGETQRFICFKRQKTKAPNNKK